MTDNDASYMDDASRNDAYFDELPPKAQSLLLAAHRLLIEKGYEGLTWSQIAKEAGEQKSVIGYYFGDKASLVLGLLKLMGQDSTQLFVEECENLPEMPERVHAFLDALRGVTARPASVAFFDVFPHARRDETLREQVADLYSWYCMMILRAFGLHLASDGDSQVKAVGWLFLAAIDGILIQRALKPEDYDADAVYEKLEAAMEYLVSTLDRSAVETA